MNCVINFYSVCMQKQVLVLSNSYIAIAKPRKTFVLSYAHTQGAISELRLATDSPAHRVQVG